MRNRKADFKQEQAISPRGTRHPSLEPVIPTDQEILEQLNQLTGEYALGGDRSPIGGGQGSRTNATGSRRESSISEDRAQSSRNVVDNKDVATPAPAPAPAPALSPASPTVAPPPLPASLPVVEALISSRLRTRPARSLKWKTSKGIGPQQDQAQPTKRKAPKESVQPAAKRSKTVVEKSTTATTAATTTTTKRVAARGAGSQPQKYKRKTAPKSSMFIYVFNFDVAMTTSNKEFNVITEAATRVEFPNLIIPNTSSSRVLPPGTHSINTEKQRVDTTTTSTMKKSKAPTKKAQSAVKAKTVPGSSKPSAAVEAVKKAAPTTAAAKKRVREEEDEDEEAGRTSPVKKLRVMKAIKVPKPKKIINHAPTRKLDVFVCGEGSSGELGLGNSRKAIDVKRPRLNHNLSASKVGVVHIAVGGMHAAALTHDGLIYTWGVNDQGALGRDTKWEKTANDEPDIDEDETVDLNPIECAPMPIPTEHFPQDTIFTHLACGDSTTFALTDNGEVWGWGTFRVSLSSLPRLPAKQADYFSEQ